MEHETYLASNFLEASSPNSLVPGIPAPAKARGGRETKGNKGFHIVSSKTKADELEKDEDDDMPPQKRSTRSGGVHQSQAMNMIQHELVFIKDHFNTMTPLLQDIFNRYSVHTEDPSILKLLEQLNGLQQHLSVAYNINYGA